MDDTPLKADLGPFAGRKSTGFQAERLGGLQVGRGEAVDEEVCVGLRPVLRGRSGGSWPVVDPGTAAHAYGGKRDRQEPCMHLREGSRHRAIRA
jgi:hypothetical protein